MVQYEDTEKSSAMLAQLNGAVIEQQTIRAEFKHKKIGRPHLGIPLSHHRRELFIMPCTEETQEYQEYYEQLTQFRDNASVSELRFTAGLTPFQRKQIHQICTKLHLGHESVGTGGDRYILVTKKTKDWSPSTRGHSFPRGRNTPDARKAVQVEYVECCLPFSYLYLLYDGILMERGDFNFVAK